ncbi:flagellin [Microbacterium sp. APC 3898]|uniref:Flagellin n=1 Tax=Planococcus notacanthi TaxID=3035188 RepID=A0ABT7ZM06_9BACL|nr:MULTISPECIES: flagellin [Terrabacteria group]MDN3427873.1 flagellin [Planococcus sp. APC 4016]MDN3498592.1 flagellin [Microbacterium sp. APC 3898]
MIINHNIAALNTHRQMGSAQSAQMDSMEKLSSGLRINSAKDDAAGLTISEKMRGQIRGLEQASTNAQGGISLIQTAEGALSETQDILQRMRELSVQSANDTNTDADRTEIQKEVDQLGKEIDRISSSTQFNTKNLLDGSMGKGVDTAVSNINTNKALDSTTVVGDLATALKDASGNSLGIVEGDTIEVSYVINGEKTTNEITVNATTDLTAIFDGAGTLAADADGTTLTAEVEGFEGAVNGLTVTVKTTAGDVRTSASNALSGFTETTAAANIRNDGQATFQIGANTGQNIQLSFENMSSSALGVKNLKVGNQGQADVAMKVLDGAIQKVSAERSKLGSTQNRLEHTINNLNTSAENLTSAESSIRDVDMAKEMMEQTKNSILAQASQAMLAQANQMNQSVLQLLR